MLIFDAVLGEKRCEYYKYSRVFQQSNVQKEDCPFGLYQIFITTSLKISSVEPATDIQFSPSIKENLMNNTSVNISEIGSKFILDL